MGGEKGGGMTAPPSYVPNTDNTAQFESTLASYKAQTDTALAANRSAFEQQLSTLQESNEDYASALPTVLGADQANIDWDAEQSKLAAKVAADQAAEDAKKRGRISTILTSPLLDVATPLTTTSILTS